MATRGKSKEDLTGFSPVLAVRDVVLFPGQVNTLQVVREPSLRALKKAMAMDHTVVVLSQKDMSVDDPGIEGLHSHGTISEVLQTIPMPDSGARVALRALHRVSIAELVSHDGMFLARVIPIEEHPVEGPEVDALCRAALDSFTRVVERNKEIPPETLQGLGMDLDAGALADAILHHLPLPSSDKQRLLEESDVRRRLEATLSLLKHEEHVLEIQQQIRERVDREIGKGQRDFYLREQLRAIQDELRDPIERDGEAEEFRQKLREARLPPEAMAKAEDEVRRLDRTPSTSPEGMVLRNYLEMLVSLPWDRHTPEQLNVSDAEALLNERHFGLDKVKDRILDHLAVLQLKRSIQGPILCFVGPPGVGKTSIGRSIAEAMGRKFVRISLGGVRDEAAIRGHRRTYVGSMPGRIIQGIRDCGANNPVVLLDEIDKLAVGTQGDPASALLEALDPEQNDRFIDHYLDVPFDLSRTLFIATANVLDSVPPALRDRMEVIPFPSYTDAERKEIARLFLIPNHIEGHGLRSDQIEIPPTSLNLLVNEYTREAGVRELGRQIAAVCRKTARRIASLDDQKVVVDEETLKRFLGQPRFQRVANDFESIVGRAWGLVVSEAGGDVVAIEVSLSPVLGTRPDLLLTGNLGPVMKESALAALTAVRGLGLPVDLRHDVHVHIPQAAIPKDGPSAGVTVAVALASALTRRKVRGTFAMSGEITLRGEVLPVGGVPEKVLAAIRCGHSDVLIPTHNRADLDEVPGEALQGIRVHLVSHLEEVLSHVLEPFSDSSSDSVLP